MTPALVLLVLRILGAVLLYAFMGFLAYFLWRDYRAAVAPRTSAPAATLIVVEGASIGMVYPLREVNLVGRAADSTLRIKDKTISAHHARLSFHAGQWWLEDLGSRNGSRVNEVPVSEPMVVTYGDRIALGQLLFRFQSGQGSTPNSDPGIEPDGLHAGAGV